MTVHHGQGPGWDTHTDIKGRLGKLAAPMDQALVALLADAQAHGFVVLCTSEFGRTPRINAAGGRHHHDVHWMIGFGGEFRPAVVGQYTKQGRIAKDPIPNEHIAPTLLLAAGSHLSPRAPRIRQILS